MYVPVVLAAGKGKRMHSELPKVLHPLLGMPLLEHVLETLEALASGETPQTSSKGASSKRASSKRAPSKRVWRRPVVVVGHGRDAVREAGAALDVTWAVQDPQQGTAHAAHLGLEAALDGEDAAEATVLVVNGDLPLLRRETLSRLLQEHQRRKAHVSLLTCELDDPFGYGRIRRESVSDGRGRLIEIVEEKDADEETRQVREVNVGTYAFDASTFREFYKQIDRDNAQGELYLTDVVVKAAQAGKTIATSSVEDSAEIAQVNSRSDLANASGILRQRLLQEHMEAGVTIDDPSTTYIEKDVLIGVDTRILPFTVIRRGAQVGPRCEVGPFAHLRAGAVLDNRASIGNFVEIKNTTVGEGSKIRHLSYLGDGVVGRGVNVGAGTIFANYDGKKKTQTTLEDGVFIGSGTILVAPVTVGEGAVTGAGSVVLKNQDVAPGEVVIGVPAKPLTPKKPLASNAATGRPDANDSST